MKIDNPQWWIVQLHCEHSGHAINYWGPYTSRGDAKHALTYDAKTCQIVKFTKALV